ncbi:hypothetical protein M1555_02220 [Patescibacteria group bacterium]|nr:hypothetical protein [Patescibacteria group bacterium]
MADTAADEGAATVLLNLESMIREYIARIDRTKKELKTRRGMLESALSNDETYRDHDQKVKEANKTKAATKKQILDAPENRALVEKVKEASIEVKELDTALSEYLREYQRMTGSNEIEGEDGEVREIVYVARLVKKTER